jgi:hypothetical protein
MFSFFQLVHDWELEVLASFLYSHKMSREGEDKIWWVPSNKGNFDVRSLYNIMASKEAIPFP